MLALKGNANALLALDIEGTSELALAKDVQRDPVKQIIEHVDLLLVRRGEKVTVDVPVHVTGEVAPGHLFTLEQQTLSVEAEATHLPEGFDISVEGLEAGAQLHASDVPLPEGTTLLTDPDAMVINVTAERTAEQADAELAEAEAEAGIEHDEKTVVEGDEA